MLIAAAVEFGGYISLAKFIVYIVLFLAWLPLLCWVYRDANEIRTQHLMWGAILFAAGAAASVLWLLIPVFFIGLLLYLISVGATSIAYVMHRNARVSEYERVLTAEHIKSLFVNEQKKVKSASKGLVFITANKNEVPAPQPKTPEFFGYSLAQELFDDALWRRASTVNFVPAPNGYNISYRIDGVATKREPIALEDMAYLMRYLKNLADLDIKEKRKPQRGRLSTKKNDEKIDWELTTSGSTAGEMAVLKLLKEYELMKLEDLGLLDEQIEKLGQLKDKKQGLFIVSGPAKTGVTSTFYSLVRSHDPFLNNINTLEKNPAAELPHITQNTYSLSDSGTTTFARRLQTTLRTGPDIVGVGDCEDAETAVVATNAASDGKVVYAATEAASVLQALAKWIKFTGNKNLAADSLLGISNQRLVRKLCDECREPYKPNTDILKKFNIPANKIKVFYRAGKVQYDKHGKPIVCEKCQGTGFYGRTAVFEVILIDERLREVIKTASNLNDINIQFRRAKMLYLQEQAIRKVAQGATSINEIIREFSPQQKTNKKGKKS